MTDRSVAAGGARRGADEPSRERYSRVETSFDAAGARLSAWLYRPDRPTGARLLVAAPGLLPDRRAVAPVARRYAAAGRPVLLFAPRGAVGSEGERNLLSPARQATDWDAALDHAARLDDVDGARPVLRGRAVAGLAALAVAAERRVAAVVARGPLVGGLPLRRQSPRALARLLGAAVRDALPVLSATVPAATDDPDAPALYAGVPTAALDRYLPEGTGARTAVPARSALALRSPDTSTLGAVRVPTLLTVARDDRVADPDAVAAAAADLPDGTLLRHPGDGLAALGAPDDDPVLSQERAFLATQA
jgi:dienelactone hydrolase